MTTKVIRSRILEHFEPALLKDLYKVCKSTGTSDNNIKTDIMLEVLHRYKKDFTELGPGTNRLAILIDNYVFKLALDKAGTRDNISEFITSEELQPYVIKTYETNGLIAVSEYITVISREEFIDRREELRKILSILSESYLLGDVGTVGKNFLNWGYRNDGDLAILDYAYIYRINGEEMTCRNCQSLIIYDENYHNLLCPNCHRKYTFTDIRRRIPMAVEEKDNFMAMSLAYKLIEPLQTFNDSLEEDNSSSENKKEVYEMGKGFGKFDDSDEMPGIDDYLKVLEKFNANKKSQVINPPVIDGELNEDNVLQTAQMLVDPDETLFEEESEGTNTVTNEFFHIDREMSNDPECIDETTGEGNWPQCCGNECADTPVVVEQEFIVLNAHNATVGVDMCVDGKDTTVLVSADTDTGNVESIQVIQTSSDMHEYMSQLPSNINMDIVDTSLVLNVELEQGPQTIDLRTDTPDVANSVQNMRDLLRMDIGDTGLSDAEKDQYDKMFEKAGQDSRIHRGGHK